MKNNLEKIDQEIIKEIVNALEFIDERLYSIIKRYKKNSKDEVILEDLLKYNNKNLNQPLYETKPVTADDVLKDKITEEEEIIYTKDYIEIQDSMIPVGIIITFDKSESFISSRMFYNIVMNKDDRSHPVLRANTIFEYTSLEQRDISWENLKLQLQSNTNIRFI